MRSILTNLPTEFVEKGVKFVRLSQIEFKDSQGNPFLPRNDEEYHKAVRRYCKENGKLKFRKIGVLARNLRGKTDIHNNPYKAHFWYFVSVK